ncbi:RidA family protein [Gordonia sp. (in: high G+C Gram-positive bacteria)]|uniref:RidA family protein n=1 Tax=Gordonia sp. (in: high G+C Gram-positive bacteria) TaxID=84139 RepID=UPI003C762F7D
MTVTFANPDGMMQGVPYHHVAIASGTRHVHVSGQVARGADGEPLGGADLAAQVGHALRNTARGLNGVGASFDDVVRLTFYVRGWEASMMPAFIEGLTRIATEIGLPTPMPPASLIGVAALFEPDVLVEVEATAVLD